MDRIIAATFNSLRALRWAAANEAAVRQELAALGLGVPLAALIARDGAGFVLLVGPLLLLLAVELLNTGLEKLSDHVTPERHPQIGLVKDLGSAAVFMMLCLNGLAWGWGLWRWWFG